MRIALNGPNDQAIVNDVLVRPLQGNVGCFPLPRAALRDVPSLRSALGYDLAAPLGPKDIGL